MSYSPTLLIALGPTGGAILQKLKKKLHFHSSSDKADGLEFLWIVYQDAEFAISRLDLISPSETIVLKLDEQELNNSLNRLHDKTAFSWYSKAHQAGNLVRADARMAFYWDWQFKKQTHLDENFTYFKQVLSRPPKTNYSVIILASLSEVDSAILFDLVTQMRIGKWQGASNAIMLWLFLDSDPMVRKPGSASIQDYDKNSMRYAAVREIHRYMSGEAHVVDQGVYEKKVLEKKLFDSLFLFDGPEAYNAVAEQLSVILDENVLNQFIRDTLNSISKIPPSEEATRLYFSSTKSYSYHFPIDEIRESFAARMAGDILFNNSEQNFPTLGIMPVALTGRELDIQPLRLEPRSLALSFFTQELQSNIWLKNAYPVSLIANAAEGRWFEREGFDQSLPVNWGRAFQERLMAFINEHFQSDSYEFLHILEEVLLDIDDILKRSEYVILQQSRGSSLFAGHFSRNLPVFKQGVNQLIDSLQNWRKIILSSLYPQSLTRVDLAKRALDAVSVPTSTQEMVRDTTSSSGSLSDSIYGEKIFLPQCKALIKNLREKINFRVGLNETGAFSLYTTVSAAEKPLHSFSDSEMGAGQFYQYWFDLCYQSLDQVLKDLSATEFLRNYRENLKLPEARLLGMEYLPAMERQTYSYLCGSDRLFLTEWTNASGLSRIGHNTLETENRDRVMFLQVDHNLVLESIAGLNDNQARKLNTVHWQIFTAEQHAGDLEVDFRKILQRTPNSFPAPIYFSSAFVRLMADPEMFEICMELVYFNLVGREKQSGKWLIKRSWQEKPPIILDEISGHQQLKEALESILIHYPYQSLNNAHKLHKNNYPQTMRDLSSAIQQHRGELSSPLEEFKQGLQNRIEDWLEMKQDFYADLANYQKYWDLKLNLQ